VLLPIRYPTIVLFLGVVFVLSACGNQDKVSDCKEYNKAVQELGRLAAIVIPGITPLDSPKQRYVKMLSFQTQEEWLAKLWQNMKMKSPTAKRIQLNMIELAKNEHQGFLKRLEIIKSLPDDASSDSIRAALKSLGPMSIALSKKVDKVFDEMNNYCKL
jgi:hypothetical protein